MLKLIIISILIVLMAIAGSGNRFEDARACARNNFNYYTWCYECKAYKGKLRYLCLECCEVSFALAEPYPKGQLEICQCKFAKYPHFEAFIKSHERRSKHPNLSIIYSNITEPWLHLLNNNGQRLESGSIADWEADVDERIDETFSFVIAH